MDEVLEFCRRVPVSPELAPALGGPEPPAPGLTEAVALELAAANARLPGRRQDSESVSSQDDGWRLDHLGTCEPYEHAHAAMLEASVCYRAWWVEDPVPVAP